MALKSVVWALAGAMWAGIVGVPSIAAVSQETPVRATKAEIAESCRAAGGMAWGMDDQEDSQVERYGCISSQGWVACDHHGNCTGGSGTAHRAAGRAGRSPVGAPSSAQ